MGGVILLFSETPFWTIFRTVPPLETAKRNIFSRAFGAGGRIWTKSRWGGGVIFLRFPEF